MCQFILPKVRLTHTFPQCSMVPLKTEDWRGAGRYEDENVQSTRQDLAQLSYVVPAMTVLYCHAIKISTPDTLPTTTHLHVTMFEIKAICVEYNVGI